MTVFPKLDDDLRRARLALPEGPVRLLIDTDTANEIDDQYALAWALLAPEHVKVEAVTAEPFSFAHHQKELLKAERALEAGEAFDEHLVGSLRGWIHRLHAQGRRAADLNFVQPDEGMELSFREIETVFAKLGMDPAGKVFRGADRYMSDASTPVRSESVDCIIDLAKSGASPLYIGAMGCVTNIASAMLLAPEIIENVVVIWTSAYPSNAPHSNRPSLNLVQDIPASRLMFESGVPLVYLPGYHVGAQLTISLPDMERFVRGRGAMGDYLHHLYTHNPLHEMFGIDDTGRRTWVIWDLIVVAWLINPDWVSTFLTPTPKLDDDLFWTHDASRPIMREGFGVQRDEIFRDLFDRLATL